VTLAGRGLRDALRLAGSPYSVWRDIILTNSDNLDVLWPVDPVSRAASRRLRTRALEEEFAAAGELYRFFATCSKLAARFLESFHAKGSSNRWISA